MLAAGARVGSPGVTHLVEMLHRPLADRDQWSLEGSAKEPQRVLDVRRNTVEHLALDQAIGLHPAKGLGEHLL